MKIPRSLFIIGLVLVMVPVGLAQTNAAPGKAPAVAKPASKPEAEAKKDGEPELTAQHQRGFDLVREAAAEAVGFDDKRNAARVLSQAGDMLWRFDQTRARELFEKAFDTAVTHYRDTKDDNLERLSHSSSTSRSDMRLEVARLATKHNAELGKKLTDRYVEEKRREAEERRTSAAAANTPEATSARNNEKLFGSQDPAAGELLRAAQALADTDPKAALQLVQRAFANGVPQSAPSFLPQAAARARKEIDGIYAAALARLTADPLAHAGQLLLLSAYPFGENRVWVTDGESNNGYGFQVPPGFQPDPQMINRFLVTALTVLNKATQLNSAQFPEQSPRIGAALFAARVLEPKIRQYQPALIDDWGVAKTRLLALSADAQRGGIDRALEGIEREKNGPKGGPIGLSKGDSKDFLERADKTSNLAERDDLLMQAAMQEARQGDLDRALGIVERIADLPYKRTVRAWLNFDAANKAIGEKRFDDARKYALEVDASDQRAYLFFQMASTALKDGDRGRAGQLLDEATRYATAADNTPEKVRALLGLANQYALLDPVRGFELADEAVKTINKIADYNPDRNQLVRVIALRNGRGANTSATSVEGFDLGRSLRTLARHDFERALLLAQSLEQKPLKYTTVLALAATLFETKQVSQVQ
jgi:hypothetical protein